MRRVFCAALAVLACGQALGAASGKPFDLVCRGQERVQENGQDWRTQRFRTVLHVDPGTGSFCDDDCPAAYTLTHWDDHALTYDFDADKQGDREPPYGAVTTIDNFTVSLTDMTFHRRLDFLTCYRCIAAQPHAEQFSGTCRRAPFSGFAYRPQPEPSP